MGGGGLKRVSRWRVAAIWLAASALLSVVPPLPLRAGEAAFASLQDVLSRALEAPPYWSLLERSLALAPVGYLAGRAANGRWRSCPLLPVLAPLAIAVAMEAIQLPFAARHARYGDALMAYWAMATGLALGLVHAGMPRAVSARVGLLGGVVTGVLAVAGVALVPSTANWTCDYPAIVGDEANGHRPWRGALSGVALYPHAIAAKTVRTLAHTPFSPEKRAVRESLGAVWVFAAEDAHGAPRTALKTGGPGVAAVHLPVAQSTLRQAFCEAVRTSHALTVEARVRTHGLPQSGPARILTFSSTQHLRNFTLGQEGDAFDVRIRTLGSGVNGAHFRVRSPPGAVERRFQHVATTYSDGAASLYVDGTLAAGPVQFAETFASDPRSSSLIFMLYLALASVALALSWYGLGRDRTATAGGPWPG